MWQKLESWRQKDESTRRTMALLVSAIITLIIAGVWATIFFRNNLNKNTAEKIVTAAAVDVKQTSPITAIGESAVQLWQSVTEQFGAVKDSLESLEEAAQKATSTEENVLE